MRFSRLVVSVAVTNLLALLVLASCSDDSKNNDTSGGAAGTAGTAGDNGIGGTAGRGGGAAAGDTGTEGGNGGAGGSSSTAPTTALNDLISAVCSWEYKCCDAGEARFEFGPTIGDVATCTAKFVYELRVDNSETNPFPSSSLTYNLLNQLGYSVNLANVTENVDGIAKCVAQWNAKDCNSAPSAIVPAPEHCTETTYGVTDACALEKLVKPALVAGDTCNLALTEGGTRNDIECAEGTTCTAPYTDGNLSSLPKCITRGQADVICTSDKDCDFNFYCNFEAGVCTEKGNPGDACAYKDADVPVAGELSEPCKAGLTCNPDTKKCVADCTTDFVCNNGAGSVGNDFLCPAGESCLPTGTLFEVCGTAANTVTECDSAEDCGAGYYCATGACAAVHTVTTACDGTSGQCAAGLYCNLTDGECATPAAAGTGCDTNTHCDPVTAAAGCVFSKCAATKLATGEVCGSGTDCASERCEITSTGDTNYHCTAGAPVNAICDDSPTTGAALSCAAGLTCVNAACVAQVGPGEDCILNDVPNGAICTNGSCNSSTWAAASATMCTANAVPTKAGGTNVSCDGK